MKTKMFSVFDTKAACFGTPFFMPKEAMAIRAFTDLVNDPKSTVGMHPEDFVLHSVGEFDDELGIVVSDKPVGLISASNVKKPFSNVAVSEIKEVNKEAVR